MLSLRVVSGSMVWSAWLVEAISGLDGAIWALAVWGRQGLVVWARLAISACRDSTVRLLGSSGVRSAPMLGASWAWGLRGMVADLVQGAC